MCCLKIDIDDITEKNVLCFINGIRLVISQTSVKVEQTAVPRMIMANLICFGLIFQMAKYPAPTCKKK